MTKILLDTNAYSRLCSKDERVLNILGNAHIVYMSIFVIAELYIGFRGGKKDRWNREILRKFLYKSHTRILDATEETASIFSEIKLQLKQAGTPIPINDVWIAAHSIETGSVLISFDSHFKVIPGLRLWEYK